MVPRESSASKVVGMPSAQFSRIPECRECIKGKDMLSSAIGTSLSRTVAIEAVDGSNVVCKTRRANSSLDHDVIASEGNDSFVLRTTYNLNSPLSPQLCFSHGESRLVKGFPSRVVLRTKQCPDSARNPNGHSTAHAVGANAATEDD